MDTEGKEGSETPPSSTTEPGIQSPFTDPRLEGKTPEEVERLYQLQDRAIREQGTKLSEYHDAEVARAGRVDDGPAEISDEEFWKSPTTTVQRLLDKAIEPFKRDLAAGRVEDAWDQARRLTGFTDYEPTIRELMATREITDPTFDTLRTLFATVVGAEKLGMIDTGLGERPVEAVEAPPTRETPAPPPQHGASRQPLPKPGEEKKKPLRDLTENERRLAREQGMTHERFLELQEMDEGEFAESLEQREGE